jgi:hypothetical protein
MFSHLNNRSILKVKFCFYLFLHQLLLIIAFSFSGDGCASTFFGEKKWEYSAGAQKALKRIVFFSFF